MQIGDRVMLVQYAGIGSRDLHIREDKIKNIHKNGLIVLESSQQKYRENGRPTGQSQEWRDTRPTMQLWDDAIWQKYQKQQIEIAATNRLWELTDHLKKMIQNNREAAAEVWESLPYQVRALVEKEPRP